MSMSTMARVQGHPGQYYPPPPPVRTEPHTVSRPTMPLSSVPLDSKSRTRRPTPFMILCHPSLHVLIVPHAPDRITSPAYPSPRLPPPESIYGSAAPSPAGNASQHYHAALPRYDPYRRPPHLNAHPLPSPQPRLMPANPAISLGQNHAASPVPMSRQKAYEANRPTGRYQPSRGAQRDARWHAKYAERQRSTAQMNDAARIPPPHVGYSAHVALDRVRAEQRTAIAAARKAHAESLRAKISGEEQQRKTRRIQLQVYVHARPTKCQWAGCEAVLNSWALVEKHIFHAHLRSRVRVGQQKQVRCQWGDCQATFADPETCHQHCLVGHMSSFSARCPFNCLYEGPEFSELMAHIGRRHPTATPDDFVPGLIHHRPLYLPPTTADLPRIPHVVIIPPEGSPDDTTRSIFLCGDLSPAYAVSERVGKLVRKGSISTGRRPRKDHFVDKEVARAAISAMVENARRISVHPSVAVCKEETNLQKDEHALPSAVSMASMTEEEAKERGIDLVDVKATLRQARHSAKRMLGTDLIVDVDSSAESVGSRPPSRATSVPMRPALRTKSSGFKSKLASSRHAEREDSIVSDDSISTSTSQYSLYPGGRTGESPGREEMDDRARVSKRSERLKRKATGGMSPDR